MRALLLALPFAAAVAAPVQAQGVVVRAHNEVPGLIGPAPAQAGIDGLFIPRYLPVTARDVPKDAMIYDPRGYRVGQVEAVESNGVVVSYAGGRTKIPFEALRRDQVLRVQMVSYKFKEVAARNPY